MWGIIGTIVVGIIAGWLAGIITKTDRGVLGDLVLGVLGGFLFGLIFGAWGDGSIWLEIVGATIGAIVLVVIKNMILGRNK
jgi:uncharacterized membrane protein YeaQ/YmgE (transglycosylase-associated protein family)